MLGLGLTEAFRVPEDSKIWSWSLLMILPTSDSRPAIPESSGVRYTKHKWGDKQNDDPIFEMESRSK